MGFARCESCAFGERRVYFYKPKEFTIHQQECVKDEAINHGQWFESHCKHFFILVKRFFIVHQYGANSEHLLNLSKQDFLARNEASTLPNFITSHIAWYNEFRTVCSIREYRCNVAETY